ncbi:hypothetical protein CRENBAI_008384 [Crenichthys baileyi]|uniref:ATP synthase F0 subunit 6 n=1 Tax=Crenichthys baileyi TaxID=28760 RepID=A0AAV9SJ42_9TELE
MAALMQWSSIPLDLPLPVSVPAQPLFFSIMFLSVLFPLIYFIFSSFVVVLSESVVTAVAAPLDLTLTLAAKLLVVWCYTFFVFLFFTTLRNKISFVCFVFLFGAIMFVSFSFEIKAVI